MNFNELANKAHSNAVKHGFWKKRLSNEHCLMLVITEIGELVEADRNKLKADKVGFDTGMANAFQGIIRPDWFDKVFQRCIKNTLEDELADIAIRLFDLAGALGIDFDKMNPCRYYRAFDKFSFTENAFVLPKTHLPCARVCPVMLSGLKNVFNSVLSMSINGRNPWMLIWLGILSRK